MDTEAYKEKLKKRYFNDNVRKGHIPPSIDNLHIRTKNKFIEFIKKMFNFVK